MLADFFAENLNSGAFSNLNCSKEVEEEVKAVRYGGCSKNRVSSVKNYWLKARLFPSCNVTLFTSMGRCKNLRAHWNHSFDCTCFSSHCSLLRPLKSVRACNDSEKLIIGHSAIFIWVPSNSPVTTFLNIPDTTGHCNFLYFISFACLPIWNKAQIL